MSTGHLHPSDLDFDNPTKRFKLANAGKARQRIILRDDGVLSGLMGGGVNGTGGPTRNSARYFYSVGRFFAREYGGGAELYDVAVA